MRLGDRDGLGLAVERAAAGGEHHLGNPGHARALQYVQGSDHVDGRGLGVAPGVPVALWSAARET